MLTSAPGTLHSRRNPTAYPTTAPAPFRARVREFVTPLRFGRVTRGPKLSGVFRGSYPTLQHFRFLKSLKLKSILSLTPEPPSADLVRFAALCNVTVIHIQIIRTDRTHAIQRQLVKAVNALIDPSLLPLYVHCLDGRRITSLAIFLMRRLQGWSVDSAIAEYWRFQPPIVPPVSDVARTDRDLSKAFYDSTEEYRIAHEIPSWLWEGDRRSAPPSGIRIKFMRSDAEVPADTLNNMVSKDLIGSLDKGATSEGVHSSINSSSDSLYVDGTFIHQSSMEAKSRYSFSGIRDSRRTTSYGAGTVENSRSDLDVHRTKVPRTPKKPIRGTLDGEDKTVIALDLAISDPSPAKLSSSHQLMRPRRHQEL